MPQMTLTRDWTQEDFDAFLRARREPAWLVEARRAAWERFEALPWPDRREEEWLRTDIRGFHLADFQLPGGGQPVGSPPRPTLDEGLNPAGQVVTLDSRPLEERL